jgi:adenylate kinase
MQPQPKKVVFDDDGEVKEEIIGFQMIESAPVELKPKTRKNRVEKRENLRKKLVKQEQEYFANKYQKEADSKEAVVPEESAEVIVETEEHKQKIQKRVPQKKEH